jgi:hypothetical protein
VTLKIALIAAMMHMPSVSAKRSSARFGVMMMSIVVSLVA